ncbi:MAG: tetratricopeptide repeat protein [Myxococcales bacterium]|nr:tetratricopeptide repeat protein [Myxococcales bacterium]
MSTFLLTFVQVAYAQAMPANHPDPPGQDWYIPLAVLVAGLAAAYLMLNQQTEGDEQIEATSRRIDLQSTVDEMVEALKALEMEKGKMDPAEYQAERESLLARGSHAMAVLDGVDVDEEAAPEAAAEAALTGDATQTPAAAAAPAGFLASLSPEWRGALYALGAVAIIVALVYSARMGASDRQKDQGMTGGEIVNQSLPGNGPDPAADPQFRAAKEALELRLKQNPNDVEAMNGFTALYLQFSDPGKAMEHNTKALEVDPQNLDARSYLGVLNMMMGMSDRALEHIDGVLKDDPEHPLALPYRGLFLMEMQRFEEAIPVLEKAIAVQPGNPSLQRALSDARKLASGEMPTPPPTASDGGQLIVSGTMDIDPAAKATLKGTETVFLSVKDPTKAGPPVAAERMAAVFPAAFELTTADIRAMPGAETSIPANMMLTIRVDLDGNAMTKEAAPIAVVENVASGSAGVNVVLSMGGGSEAAPGGAPAAGQTLAAGSIQLAPGAAASPNQILFLSLKDPAGGPPLAAKRVPGPSFPLSFELTTADLLPMAGNRPVPATLLVSARLDNDGNATTKDGEPEATQGDVSKGATGIGLTLR